MISSWYSALPASELGSNTCTKQAAVSADRLAYIVDPQVQKITQLLSGHTGSAKVIAWDPNHNGNKTDSMLVHCI